MYMPTTDFDFQCPPRHVGGHSVSNINHYSTNGPFVSSPSSSGTAEDIRIGGCSPMAAYISSESTVTIVGSSLHNESGGVEKASFSLSTPSSSSTSAAPPVLAVISVYPLHASSVALHPTLPVVAIGTCEGWVIVTDALFRPSSPVLVPVHVTTSRGGNGSPSMASSSSSKPPSFASVMSKHASAILAPPSRRKSMSFIINNEDLDDANGLDKHHHERDEGLFHPESLSSSSLFSSQPSLGFLLWGGVDLGGRGITSVAFSVLARVSHNKARGTNEKKRGGGGLDTECLLVALIGADEPSPSPSSSSSATSKSPNLIVAWHLSSSECLHSSGPANEAPSPSADLFGGRKILSPSRLPSYSSFPFRDAVVIPLPPHAPTSRELTKLGSLRHIVGVSGGEFAICGSKNAAFVTFKNKSVDGVGEQRSGGNGDEERDTWSVDVWRMQPLPADATAKAPIPREEVEFVAVAVPDKASREGKSDTFVFAILSSGLLVCFSATSGSASKWVDCRFAAVATATSTGGKASGRIGGSGSDKGGEDRLYLTPFPSVAIQCTLDHVFVLGANVVRCFTLGKWEIVDSCKVGDVVVLGAGGSSSSSSAPPSSATAQPHMGGIVASMAPPPACAFAGGLLVGTSYFLAFGVTRACVEEEELGMCTITVPLSSPEAMAAAAAAKAEGLKTRIRYFLASRSKLTAVPFSNTDATTTSFVDLYCLGNTVSTSRSKVLLGLTPTSHIYWAKQCGAGGMRSGHPQASASHSLFTSIRCVDALSGLLTSEIVVRAGQLASSSSTSLSSPPLAIASALYHPLLDMVLVLVVEKGSQCAFIKVYASASSIMVTSPTKERDSIASGFTEVGSIVVPPPSVPIHSVVSSHAHALDDELCYDYSRCTLAVRPDAVHLGDPSFVCIMVLNRRGVGLSSGGGRPSSSSSTTPPSQRGGGAAGGGIVVIHSLDAIFDASSSEGGGGGGRVPTVSLSLVSSRCCELEAFIEGGRRRGDGVGVVVGGGEASHFSFSSFLASSNSLFTARYFNRDLSVITSRGIVPIVGGGRSLGDGDEAALGVYPFWSAPPDRGEGEPSLATRVEAITGTSGMLLLATSRPGGLFLYSEVGATPQRFATPSAISAHKAPSPRSEGLGNGTASEEECVKETGYEAVATDSTFEFAAVIARTTVLSFGGSSDVDDSSASSFSSLGDSAEDILLGGRRRTSSYEQRSRTEWWLIVFSVKTLKEVTRILVASVADVSEVGWSRRRGGCGRPTSSTLIAPASVHVTRANHANNSTTNNLSYPMHMHSQGSLLITVAVNSSVTQYAFSDVALRSYARINANNMLHNNSNTCSNTTDTIRRSLLPLSDERKRRERKRGGEDNARPPQLKDGLRLGRGEGRVAASDAQANLHDAEVRRGNVEGVPMTPPPSVSVGAVNVGTGATTPRTTQQQKSLFPSSKALHPPQPRTSSPSVASSSLRAPPPPPTAAAAAAATTSSHTATNSDTHNSSISKTGGLTVKGFALNLNGIAGGAPPPPAPRTGRIPSRSPTASARAGAERRPMTARTQRSHSAALSPPPRPSSASGHTGTATPRAMTPLQKQQQERKAQQQRLASPSRTITSSHQRAVVSVPIAHAHAPAAPSADDLFSSRPPSSFTNESLESKMALLEAFQRETNQRASAGTGRLGVFGSSSSTARTPDGSNSHHQIHDATSGLRSEEGLIQRGRSDAAHGASSYTDPYALLPSSPPSLKSLLRSTQAPLLLGKKEGLGGRGWAGGGINRTSTATEEDDDANYHSKGPLSTLLGVEKSTHQNPQSSFTTAAAATASQGGEAAVGSAGAEPSPLCHRDGHLDHDTVVVVAPTSKMERWGGDVHSFDLELAEVLTSTNDDSPVQTRQRELSTMLREAERTFEAGHQHTKMMVDSSLASASVSSSPSAPNNAKKPSSSMEAKEELLLNAARGASDTSGQLPTPEAIVEGGVAPVRLRLISPEPTLRCGGGGGGGGGPYFSDESEEVGKALSDGFFGEDTQRLSSSHEGTAAAADIDLSPAPRRRQILHGSWNTDADTSNVRAKSASIHVDPHLSYEEGDPILSLAEQSELTEGYINTTRDIAVANGRRAVDKDVDEEDQAYVDAHSTLVVSPLTKSHNGPIVSDLSPTKTTSNRLKANASKDPMADRSQPISGSVVEISQLSESDRAGFSLFASEEAFSRSHEEALDKSEKEPSLAVPARRHERHAESEHTDRMDGIRTEDRSNSSSTSALTQNNTSTTAADPLKVRRLGFIAARRSAAIQGVLAILKSMESESLEYERLCSEVGGSSSEILASVRSEEDAERSVETWTEINRLLREELRRETL